MTGEERLLRTMINRALFAFEKKTGISADEWKGLPDASYSVKRKPHPIYLKATVKSHIGYQTIALGTITLLGDCLAIDGERLREMAETGMESLREANDLLAGLNFERRWQRCELTNREIATLDAFSKAKYAKNCKRKEQRK